MEKVDGVVGVEEIAETDEEAVIATVVVVVGVLTDEEMREGGERLVVISLPR